MNSFSMTGNLILVRHAQVAAEYRGFCYGRSDVPLGTSGEQHSRQVAENLATYMDAIVIHSGLQRTCFLAEQIAERLDGSIACCEALRERDFGTWELQRWDVIYAREGEEMLRMVSEPDTFRPGGGETTSELRKRVLRWFDSLPEHGLIIAITHGGPIAALVGTLRELPVSDWVDLIPRCGQWVTINKRNAEQR